jgi:DNA-binding MarR family transcriptional regulator
MSSAPPDAPKATQQGVMTLAEDLRPTLLRISRRLRQEAQRLGASALDVTLLSHIRRHPGIGVSGMAELEHMSKPSMSGHIKRLESLGLVARSGDAEDGRRSGLTLTEQGTRQLVAIRQLRNDWLAVRLDRLTAEDQEKLKAAIEPLMRLVSIDPTD